MKWDGQCCFCQCSLWSAGDFSNSYLNQILSNLLKRLIFGFRNRAHDVVGKNRAMLKMSVKAGLKLTYSSGVFTYLLSKGCYIFGALVALTSKIVSFWSILRTGCFTKEHRRLLNVTMKGKRKCNRKDLVFFCKT